MNKKFKISVKAEGKRAVSSIYKVVKVLKTKLIVENKKGEKLTLKKIMVVFTEKWDVVSEDRDYNYYKVKEVEA